MPAWKSGKVERQVAGATMRNLPPQEMYNPQRVLIIPQHYQGTTITCPIIDGCIVQK